MIGEKTARGVFGETGVEYAENYPLKGKCTYGTGGNADYAFFPKTAEEVVRLTETLKKCGEPYFFLGAGSNVLVSDEGYRGAVVFTEKLKGVSYSGKLATVRAGERLNSFIDDALMNSLGGIEFLSGIPASVGGAVAMNAGCFGKNVGDYVSYVVSTDGIYTAENCGFGYRTSVFKETGVGIISVCFDLDNVEYEQSEGKIAKYRALRRSKVPKGRSCGSVFKNDGYFAGKVIESAGLKGFSIGGARVSDKHANFIIADDSATSGDVYRLISEIKKRTLEKCGVKLREEVEYIGSFDCGNVDKL